ncbi:FadD3 family acyl-CoA ligase [soil metagenome]
MPLDDTRALTLAWSSALDLAAEEHGDKPAFHFGGQGWDATLSFATWSHLSHLAADALEKLGVGRGDRVAVLAPGGPVYPILQTACSELGAIIVPINTRYRLDELEYVFGLAEPTVIVSIARFHTTDYLALIRSALSALPGREPRLVAIPQSDILADAQPDLPGEFTWSAFLDLGRDADSRLRAPSADDSVLLQFTSGSTAFPKGALLSNRASLGATYHLGRRMDIVADDVYFSTQPLYHVGGSVATTLMALAHGCTMVVPERYSPEEVFRLVPRYACTVRTGQAAMYAMEFAHPDFDPAIFATVVKGWAGGTPEFKQVIADTLGIPALTTIYGLTETAGSTTVTATDDTPEVWARSCGSALPGLEVGVQVDGSVVSTAGQVGEICVRGWSVMDGYFRNPEATAEAIDPDGWFHTGDLGSLDEAGNLYFVDRIKDMIKPGGENVSAAEVERVIGDLPSVAQVAVIGMPDARLGEVPVAFVEAKPGAVVDAEAIIEYCRSRMASFKVPTRVFAVHDWPMTESGKIVKRELASRLPDSDVGNIGKAG